MSYDQDRRLDGACETAAHRADLTSDSRRPSFFIFLFPFFRFSVFPFFRFSVSDQPRPQGVKSSALASTAATSATLKPEAATCHRQE
jgi:hypothetical protein